MNETTNFQPYKVLVRVDDAGRVQWYYKEAS